MSYKYSGDINEITVTQTDFGKWLGFSQSRISQLLSQGILIRDETDKTGRLKMAASIKHYVESKQDHGDEASYWHEKALREQINRKIDALKLRKMEGELYEAETVERVMIEQLTNFRNKLLGLPAKMASQLEGKSRGDIYDLMNAEIEAALEELSNNYKGADFNEDETDAEEEDAFGAETD